MFKALFNIILKMVATLVQIICLPINTLIDSLLPDLSAKIQSITTTFSTLFQPISWLGTALPTIVTETLAFIMTIEIAKITIFRSSFILGRVWKIIQKIKFW